MGIVTVGVNSAWIWQQAQRGTLVIVTIGMTIVSTATKAA